ncbi:MAG TPA: hypothetical protein VGL61_12390 [Kofleriaceae bacterium]
MGAATSQAVVTATLVVGAIVLAALPARADAPTPADAPTGSDAVAPAPANAPTGSNADSPASADAPTGSNADAPVVAPTGSNANAPAAAPSDAPAAAPSVAPAAVPSGAPGDAKLDARADAQPRPHGDSCTGISTRGGRFAACFDPGNRLSITAAAADGRSTSAGAIDVGFGIRLRHEITFDDDPDLEWKMSHVLIDGAHDTGSSSFDAIVYSGLYLRHSRDGHIVIPFGVPKKVYLPFDVGALAEVGRFDWRAGSPTATVSVVRVAPLVDFARSQSERAVLAIGPAAHWDIAWDPEMRAVSEHRVAPFSEGLVDLRLESHDGLTIGDARVEAGTAWHSVTGWRPEFRAQASLERTVIAVDDRPVALTLGVQYDTVTGEAVASLGARIVLVTKTDPRVNLTPLASR